MDEAQLEVLTVGHSNHAQEEFVSLLREYGVTAVADVRSSPYSRFCPHFNREELKEGLREAGIAYVFLGQELGGRSDDRADYKKQEDPGDHPEPCPDGRSGDPADDDEDDRARTADPAPSVVIDYACLAGKHRFQEGIDRVVQGAKRWRIALMCSEKEPLDCHRTLLVAPALEIRGVAVRHIRVRRREARLESELECHEAALDRLCTRLNGSGSAGQGELFPPSEGVRQIARDRALRKQASKVGHRWPAGAPPSAGAAVLNEDRT